jgi:GTPase SAR1 family protein
MTSADRDDPLSSASERLAKVARDLGLATVARQIDADAVRRLGSGRLRVLVLGEIKHGKSSLINAIVGQKLLPVGVTPTTGAVVAVRSGEKPGRFLVAENGKRKLLTEDRFDAMARGTDPQNGSLLATTKESPIPRSIELIDTPGLNDIDRFRGAISRGELPRADVIILVLDATQVLTRTELMTIKEAIAALGGLEDSGATLELVINRIDLVAERDRPSLVEHVCSQLADVVPDATLPFQTDARSALREPEADRMGVLEVERLRKRLRNLSESRGQILPARMRTALLRQQRLLSYNAAIQARALTLDRETLETEVEAVKRALQGSQVDLEHLRTMISTGRERVLADSKARINRFRSELESASRHQIEHADLRSLTDVLPGALQDAFLDFTRQETDTLRNDLDAVTHEVLRTHGEQARRRLFEATLHLGFRGPRIYVEPPSVAVEAGMIALGVVGTGVMYFGNMIAGLVMMIASPLMTMILREKSVRDAREHARNLVPDALSKTCDNLENTIARVTRAHAAALDEHVTIASQALGEQLSATLACAQTRLDDDASRKQAQEHLADLETELNGLRGLLENLTLGPAYNFDDFETPTVIH